MFLLMKETVDFDRASIYKVFNLRWQLCPNLNMALLQNKNRAEEWERNMTDNKVSEVPHVSWWKVGEDAVAMTETPIGTVY